MSKIIYSMLPNFLALVVLGMLSPDMNFFYTTILSLIFIKLGLILHLLVEMTPKDEDES